MKKYLIPVLAAGAMTAAGLGFAGAATAAPVKNTPVSDTVKSLQASGYNVILSRSGGAELSSCSVTSVTPGQTYSTTDSRGSSSPNETILAKTMYVDVAC